MRNYKDLLVWERAHCLTLAVYKRTATFPSEERFGLISQTRCAAASMAANLAEGCGRRSDGEMGRFIHIAMGSGAELSYHLLLARDLNFLDANAHKTLDADLAVVMRMMSSLSQKIRADDAAPKISVVPIRGQSQQPKAKS